MCVWGRHCTFAWACVCACRMLCAPSVVEVKDQTLILIGQHYILLFFASSKSKDLDRSNLPALTGRGSYGNIKVSICRCRAACVLTSPVVALFH